jgi:hypothetical protein
VSEESVEDEGVLGSAAGAPVVPQAIVISM